MCVTILKQWMWLLCASYYLILSGQPLIYCFRIFSKIYSLNLWIVSERTFNALKEEDFDSTSCLISCFARNWNSGVWGYDCGWSIFPKAMELERTKLNETIDLKQLWKCGCVCLFVGVCVRVIADKHVISENFLGSLLVVLRNKN